MVGRIRETSCPLIDLVGKPVAYHHSVTAIRIAPGRASGKVLCLLLCVAFAAAFPIPAAASISAKLAWSASLEPNVTGYNIYYGTSSHNYTNSLSVGAATNVVISGLVENTAYFFAAKAHDGAGNESDFSKETAFTASRITPNSVLQLATLPKNFNGDPLSFSLSGNTLPGAAIDPINGIVYWTPTRTYASTTNFVNVNVTDTLNPALSMSETLRITVGGWLEFHLGSATVPAGQANNLPLTVSSGAGITNVQIVLNWPSSQLINPALTFVAPITSGSLQHQNNQLVIRLQTTANTPLTGTNQVGRVTFQAASGQPSTILNIPGTTSSCNTLDGLAYANVLAQPGEVVVVGSQPLLNPSPSASGGRTLSLYANPGTYELLYTTSLARPITWTPLLTYRQTNIAQTVSLGSAKPVIFYRLQQL